MSDKIREAFDAWRSSGSWTRPDDPGEWAAWQAAIAQQPEPVAVPEGWQLVPVEPTRAMWAAAGDAVTALQHAGIGHHDMISGATWGAMLAAAPAAEQPDTLRAEIADLKARLLDAERGSEELVRLRAQNRRLEQEMSACARTTGPTQEA